MNKFIYLIIILSTIQLRAQSGLEIISVCSDSLVCTSASSCDSTSYTTSIIALTDCPNSIINYNVEVDYFDDGTIDTIGVVPNFTGIYPLGTHRIKYTLFDFCGQIDSCDFLFEVEDCVAPFIQSIGVLDTFIVPFWGSIGLNANEISSIQAFDNCTSSGNLIYSFSTNLEDSTRMFNCQYMDPCFPEPIPIWVTDQSGLQDSTIAYFEVIDPAQNCLIENFPLPIKVETWQAQPMDSVTFLVNGFEYLSNTISPVLPCDTSGFFNNQTMLEAVYDVNPLNGVTTFDIVLIAKHILGTQVFNNPHQLIAADVNFSSSITTLDIIEIRKLILFIENEFPSGKSWVFDPPSMNLIPNPNYPPYLFTGIKLGDVNGSANPNNLQSSFSETRTNSPKLIFSIQDQTIQKGQPYTIPIFAENFENIIGGQFALDFDLSVLQFENIQSNFEGLNENNFGLSKASEGLILCSWNSAHNQTLNPKGGLCNITFTALNNGKLSDFISLDFNPLNPEVYLEKENKIEILDIFLKFQKEHLEKDIKVTPNPFHENTRINFSLNESKRVYLNVYDQNGRIVFSQQRHMEQGENYFEIQKFNLPSTGIYLFQIVAEDHLWNGKLFSH